MSYVTNNTDGALAAINNRFEEKEAQNKAQQAQVPYIDLAQFPINPDVLTLIPLKAAQELKTVPFYRNGLKLRLAVVDVGLAGVKKLKLDFEERGFSVELALCSEHGLQKVLSLYNSELVAKKKIELQQNFEEDDKDNLEAKFLSFGALEKDLKTLAAAETLNAIEIMALQVKASDIHIQPYEDHGMLRFRIDGILHDIAQLNFDRAKKLINHIKYQSGMKSNISHIPQDGSLSFKANGRKIDLRVSTLPTEWNESVVMRVLDSRKGIKNFTELGFDTYTQNIIDRALSRKSGMVLVTGPTGSGKTTTLYAMLKQLNKSDRKLVSLEDPVEYHLDGVTQSPVDQESDYTFSNGLKALLRHDPDVILIGEIRDGDTAKLASEAALTGHVVLSSLHTNSALGAITRLRNLGLESFNVSSALNAVFAQRLVRRVCPHCAVKNWIDLSQHKRADNLLKWIKKTYPETKAKMVLKNEHEEKSGTFLQILEPQGCGECSHTGYFGQTVICETIWFTEALRSAIARDDNEQALKVLIGDQGTLFSDGLRKAILGQTTLDEVYRVAG